MAETATNLLGAETSPYLLQHRDNPVHWRPWGEAAFAEARAADKPVLLSVGYAACHWCHVMAHESFEDAEIAALMNRLFVNVKVDREERPDIDALYQQALAAMGQSGGWPLTMFLRPDGQPFWGGTYFPPRPRYGRPGFPEVLEGVARIYREDAATVESNVQALAAAFAKAATPQGGDGLDIGVIDQVAQRLTRQIDPFHGGFGDAPKFPNVPQYELLLRAWLRSGKTPYRTALETTLTGLAQGGIYDHLGGGWARYSTDERWLVPHFEKMLYDNAQLLRIFTLGWQAFGTPLYRRRVEETVAWLLREMVAANGAFASSLDADSEGVEGRFYVWTEAEVDAALADFGAEDRALFKRVYDVSRHGNWEHSNVLNRLHHPQGLDAAAEARLAAMVRALAVSRETRTRPGWDDKVLADWNGLTIAALAEAAFAFDRPDWLEAARRAFAAVMRDLTVGGRLRHSWRAGRAGAASTLDDHAAMARAALALHAATGEALYLDAAGGLVATLNRHFWDAEGGYFYTADDGERLIARRKDAHDGSTPSGNGLMVEILARLHQLTGDDFARQRAEALISTFAGELGRNLFPMASLLNGAELLMAGAQIVVVGEAGAADTAALLAVLRRTALPNASLQRIAPGAALPAHHPAAGKGMVGGRATAYLCRDRACSPPVTAAEDLAALLGAGR